MITNVCPPLSGRAPLVLCLALPALLLAGCSQQTSPELTAGDGVSLSNGEISMDPGVVQTRVSGSCASGMVMTGVNEDGSVVCVSNDTAYSAGEGLALSGTTFSVDQGTIEGWARGVAFHTESELTTLLDDNYLAASHVPSWSALTGVPADLADGDDDTRYEAGSGLQLSGTRFSVDTSATQARITGACGSGLAMQGVNSDGTVLCGSPSNIGSTLGSSRSIATLGTMGFMIPHVTIGTDGLPLILHSGTKLVHCEDKACKTFTQTNYLG